ANRALFDRSHHLHFVCLTVPDCLFHFLLFALADDNLSQDGTLVDASQIPDHSAIPS
ncbi:MAG: hypothetical protein ACI8QF_004235, partial [Limisphaerales bacterium]